MRDQPLNNAVGSCRMRSLSANKDFSVKSLWFSVSLWLKCRRKLLPLRQAHCTESRRDERAHLLGRSTFTNLFIKTIWLALLFAAGFALWHFLPESIRSEFTRTAYAATLTVNSADDHNDGVCNAADCTLREALNAASPGDTISFNIAGSGVHTINATSGFNITKTVTVDGTTQPGFAGAPLIELNGAGAGAGVNGLSVNAPNVIIKGLIVNRFSGYGINFDSFGNSSVQGCYIGTNAAGTAASANGAGGIRINARGITIGGTSAGAGNVISGNDGSGIAVTGGSGTSILGNFIGLNAAGTQGISNGGSGVNISGGAAVVGGLPGSRNVISGNNRGIVFGGIRPAQALGVRAGVLISGGSGSQVVGNSIGTDASGTGIIPNDSGVVIEGAVNNLIGVATPAGGNVIKGNVFDGVHIEGPQATNNIVQSNLIASNGFNGVAISDGASNNRIGGTELRAGNTITGNGFGGFFGSSGGGVFIGSGTGNAVLGNSIYSNALLGIDLGGSGVTANDNCESAVGPNINPQNFPVITSASADSTTTTIRGTLNSTANTQFRIEFFANAACDSSGNGEGQRFLGFVNTTTDASCNANLSFSFPNDSGPGPIITATATDPNNNTSEFSACATPMGVLPTIQFSAASYTIGEGDKHVDIPITRSGDTSVAASVNFATSDLAGTQPCNITIGVASSRCDYETRLATVSFAPGETSKTISVSIMDDSYLEGPESFNVKLTNPSGAFIGAPSEVTVTITDNDLANGPNLIDAPDVFVRAHYLGFLNREPDQSGFDFWTNQITSCGTDQTCIQLKRINVSAAFFLSIEFQQAGYFIERIYKTAYGDANGFSTNGGAHVLRVPLLRFNQFRIDTQQISAGVIVGQSGWETVLENNKRAYAMQIAPSAAYAYPALTPSEFVDRLFANAGFTPSTADRNAAIAEFAAAKDISDIAARARALRDVADNPNFIQQEFNRAFVLMDYFGYLRRNPNDYPDSDYSGYDFWLTKLNQFNGDYQKSEMVKAFINSAEYRQRFGP